MTRLLFLLYFLMIGSAAFAQSSVYGDYSFYKRLDTTTMVLKEEFTLDMDGDNKTDTIKIENLKDLEGDPEDFSEITIQFGNGKSVTTKNVSGYFRDSSISISATVLYASKRIMVIDGPAFYKSIILNGYQYPSCQNHLMIVSIMENGSFIVRDFDIAATKIHSEPKSEKVEITGIDHCSNESATKTFIHQPKLNKN